MMQIDLTSSHTRPATPRRTTTPDARACGWSAQQTRAWLTPGERERLRRTRGVLAYLEHRDCPPPRRSR